MQVTLENVVTTANVGCKINLKTLAWVYSGKYIPKSFAACQLRIAYPKTTALVFSSGKIVCPGAKSESMSRLAIYLYFRMICKLHPHARLRNMSIQNMVGSAFLQKKVRLSDLHRENFSRVQYDPDIFPGARVTLSIGGMHASVFLSGKVIISGAKNREELKNGFIELKDIVSKYLRDEDADAMAVVEHRDITVTMQTLKNS